MNEKADRLAKIGATDLHLVKVKSELTRTMSVYPQWENSIIDQPLKKFVNTMMIAHYDREWASLSTMEDLQNVAEESSSKNRWRALWDNIGRNKGQYCTSEKKSRAWVFQIKCLAKQLPTKAALHKRRPKVYETNMCISCLRKEESQDHLAFCEVYRILWKRVRNEVCRYVMTKVKEKGDLLTVDETIW